jgi:DNA-binding transcriptional LysR family regulator
LGLLAARRLDPPLFRQIGLVRRRDKALTPPVQAFVAALEQFGRTLGRRRRAPAPAGSSASRVLR